MPGSGSDPLPCDTPPPEGLTEATKAWEARCQEVTIEQGPEPLVDLLVEPPAWMHAALAILMLAVIGLAALGYHRHGGLTPDVLEEMAEMGLIALGTIVATHAAVSLLHLSYIADVLVGTGGGFVGAKLVCRPQAVNRQLVNDWLFLCRFW